MPDRSSIIYYMNTLTLERRSAVIRCLVDGVSIRGTTRITGVSKNTIQKLTRDVGQACLEFQDAALRDLNVKKVQCDEIWCFCYAKDKNLPDAMRNQQGVGSMWTWTAMDADSKLIISWQLGARDAANAWSLMADIKDRVANRIQITTDGNRLYVDAVENYFGAAVDFAQLIKVFESDSSTENRYSPGKCLGTRKIRVMGEPDMQDVSTSYMERQNLNIRMQNRRFTRLTNAFSKKAEMLAYSIAINFMYHNFVRVHQSIKTTPAIKAGVTKHKWTIEDMVQLVPDVSYNTRPKKDAD